MIRITTRAELVALAEELGLSAEWHEPDNQSLDATVEGGHLDNAGFWPAEMTRDHVMSLRTEKRTGHTVRAVTHPATGDTFCGQGCNTVEINVILWRTDVVDGQQFNVEPLACVNLATLFAWATGLDDASRTRIDWKTEHDRALDHLNRLLADAGIDSVSLGNGVRDLITQRNEQRHRADVAEDRLRDVHARVERLRHNPNLSPEVVAELLEAVGDVPTTERLTEVQYRSKIVSEIYAFGANLEREAAHRGVGLAARAIVDEVGDRVGKMPEPA